MAQFVPFAPNVEVNGETVLSVVNAFPPYPVETARSILACNGIGLYKLIEIDYEKKEAIMRCNNPYPCDFDRGIITTMARKFRPADSKLPMVILDKSKPGRFEGADESWYIVTW